MKSKNVREALKTDTTTNAGLLAAIAALQQQVLGQNDRLGDMEKKLLKRLEVENNYTGVEQLVNAHDFVIPPEGLPEPFTAREYAEYVRGNDLSFCRCVSLGRHAAACVEMLRGGEMPKKRNGYAVYYYDDLVAWEVVYNSWLYRF